MADHAQNSPRGLYAKNKVTLANSTGSVTLTPASGGGAKIANTTGNVTLTPTAGGGVNLGVAAWALTAKSTGIIIGALAKYINVNTTGIRIGTKYIFTTSVAGGGQ